MPLFIIMCIVLSSAAVGAVFNYKLELGDWSNDFFGLKIKHPEVSAQTGDTTITEVRVRNAPPQFSVDAQEVPASTSTSPVNNGSTIDFEATAVDPEANGYYLIVCATPGVVASTTGGQPACVGDQFCVSGSFFPSNTVASCTATINSVAEVLEWYAYACDNHATEGECSYDYSQGAAPGNYASSSPLYVNHAPSFTGVNTDDDDKDPGENYTVVASVTDADVIPVRDELSLYVCGSDDWTIGGGCGGQEICRATSTSPDISCVWATTTPAVAGTFTYWAFVVDEHEFAAVGNPQTGTYTVNNVAPQVSSVRLNGSIDIILAMKEQDRVVATSSAVITDNNTCHDIVDATSTIYWSGATNENNCSPDDDDCYQIGLASCMVVPGSCVGTSTQASVICSTTLAFHAIPTDGSGGNYPYAGNWLAGIKGLDSANNWGVATTAPSYGVDVQTLLALTVLEANIDYAVVTGGQNTGPINATTTIENYGNAPLNSEFSGTDMVQTGVAYIAAPEQRFGTSSASYLSLAYALPATTTPAVVHGVDVAKPSTGSTTVQDEVYWGINIPSGKPSGIYTGLNTFMAALDNNHW